jgi:ABC-type dipeptide/oligopeptide/nickel transport system permease component
MLQRLFSLSTQSLITLVGTSLLVFVLIRVVPGDPTDLLTSPETPQYLKVQLRKSLGLDRPIFVQYGIFLRQALQGDFGNSLRFQRPAAQLVASAFPATLELTVVALLVAVLISGPLGMLAGRYPGSLAERMSMLLALLGQSVPNFWLGIVLIVLFSVQLHWLPTSGRGSVQQLIMPCAALASYNIGLIARLTRSGVLDVLRQDYIRTARAKGVGEFRVLVRHAIRNTLIPITTIVGLQFGTLLGGAIIVETVFAWPGIGTLMIDAIHWRDYPIVQAGVLLSAVVFVLINYLLDVMYVWIDPRIRYG